MQLGHTSWPEGEINVHTIHETGTECKCSTVEWWQLLRGNTGVSLHEDSCPWWVCRICICSILWCYRNCAPPLMCGFCWLNCINVTQRLIWLQSWSTIELKFHLHAQYAHMRDWLAWGTGKICGTILKWVSPEPWFWRVCLPYHWVALASECSSPVIV